MRIADSHCRGGVKHISGLIYHEEGCRLRIHNVVVVSNIFLVLSMKEDVDSEEGCVNVSLDLSMKTVSDSCRCGGVKHISGLIYEGGC